MSLGLPAVLTPQSLHAFVESTLGRDIALEEQTVPTLTGSLCGMWLAAEGDVSERVLYRRGNSNLHRQHIINHEYAHILQRHRLARTIVSDIQVLIPDLPKHLVAQALTPNVPVPSENNIRESDVEAVAEAIADLLTLKLAETPTPCRRVGFGRVLQ